MDRRKFLKASSASVASVSAGLSGLPLAAAQTTTSPEVVVVGAGTFGAWTAYHLNRLGAKVVLLDAFGPGNSRSSSGGETRQMQADRPSDVYTRSAKTAYGWWKQLEQESGEKIVLETGKLMLSTSDRGSEAVQELRSRHAEYGIGEAEVLGPDELRYRWPQIYSDDIRWAVYTRHAAGCVMMARHGIETVASQFESNGGKVRIAYCKPEFDSGDRVSRLALSDGSTLSAQHYVFACGPWLATLFPELLKKRLRVQRRDVLFFGSPPGDPSFAYPNLPTWGEIGSGYYGFPDIQHRGFKVAPYPDKNAIDPTADDRLIMPHQVRRGRAYLQQRFPKMAAMPISESRVCQVTDTVDTDFMADLHPGADNVSIVGGGSGHGFKHGPSVGEHVAKMVLGETVDAGFADAFKLLKGEFA